MSDDKPLTIEQKRELLIDILGANEEIIDTAIQILEEEKDRREKKNDTTT